MGHYSDLLAHRLRARRNAASIRHPRSAGVVMWCSSCRAELLRAPKGQAPTMRQQQVAVDRHAKICPLRHLDRTRTAAAIERGQRRILHRQWWHKRRAWFLAAALVMAATVWALWW